MDLREEDLSEIWKKYQIPTLVVMEVPRIGFCDDHGFTSDPAILESHMVYELRLSFCHPLRDILDILGLSSP